MTDYTTATRQIMWNVSDPANTVVMYLMMVIALLIGFIGLFRQFELWKSGKPANEYLGNYLQKFFDFFKWGVVQHGVVRESAVAVAHTMIYLGFIALFFATTIVFIHHDLGYFFQDLRIYQGNFYLFVTVFSDVLGFAALIGCFMIAYRRYFEKPDQLHNVAADAFFLIFIVVMIVQGFLLEGLRIHVTNDPWAAYSPIGLVVAKLMWFLDEKPARVLHFMIWWSHTITVFAFIALLPYTKALHIVNSSLNLFFKSSTRPKGALANPGDIAELIETEEEFSLGTGSIQDYSWKQLMDLTACTSCGRCQSVCPAYRSGKPLSPKWLILDTRNHALLLNADDQLDNSIVPKSLKKLDAKLTKSLLLANSGVRNDQQTYQADGNYRGDNEAIHKTVNNLASSPDQNIAGDLLSTDVFWSCTTCYACVDACPVGINHVDQIVENRRNQVLMHGQIPSEAQATLRTLETQANPYGSAEDRVKWFEDLDIPVLKAGDQVDYLYWVGCISAYDPRKQNIARSLVKIMQTAGLSFGILGKAEGCTGDPARRLGEENLFQTLAKQNLEVLQSIKFKYIVANCPHCFNSLKNEYPQFGKLSFDHEPEVIHHSKLINHLVDEGKITLEQDYESYTYHDPCYLGRYNDQYDEPREVLQKSSRLQIVEMQDNKEKGLCCGAGGGHFWMDLKQGERINDLRTKQAAATGAKKIATACPFCMQMMEDGVKQTGKEDSLEVRDLAEVVAENLIQK